MSDEVRAIVLSGGGSKGAYEAGVLRWLLFAHKIHYQIICGVSVGAINGAELAQHKKGQEMVAAIALESKWKNLRQEEVYKSWFLFGKFAGLWKPSLYNSKPLRGFLERSIDTDKIKKSGKTFLIGSVSLDTKKYVRFNGSSDLVVDYILASSSYPGALLPVKIDGQLYTDGGARNVAPLGDAIKCGATHIDVIMNTPVLSESVPLSKPNTIDVALRTVDIMTDEIIENDIKEALYVNRLVRFKKYSSDLPYAEMEDAFTVKDIDTKKEIEIRIIRPKQSLTQDSLDFNHDLLMDMFNTGYEDAQRFLPLNS